MLLSFGVHGSENHDKVITIFRTYCLRCHGPQKAEGGIDRIDDLERLIDEGLVNPGDPESSLIWQSINPDNPVMPPENELALPIENAEVIKNWILNISATTKKLKNHSGLLTNEDLRKEIVRDLRVHPDRAYFTWLDEFNELRSTGAHSKIDSISSGIFQILNSMAWQANMVAPAFLDEDRAIAIVDWNKFGRLNGDIYRTEIWSSVLEQCNSITGLPVADFRCTLELLNRDPQLYYEWLGLPSNESILLKVLRIDFTKQTAATLKKKKGSFPPVIATAVEASETFAPLPRLFTRFAISKDRYYWRSLEVKNAKKKNDSFYNYPFFDGTPYSHLTYKYDFTETIFSLPNGLQAYMITDSKGNLIPISPGHENIGEGSVSVTPGLSSGFNCAGCHWSGVIDPNVSRPGHQPETMFYNHVRASGSQLFRSESVEKRAALVSKVVKLYPSARIVSKQIKKDEKVFALGLQRSAGHQGERINNGILDWLQSTNSVNR